LLEGGKQTGNRNMRGGNSILNIAVNWCSKADVSCTNTVTGVGSKEAVLGMSAE
jgi:hypothetical protein